MMKDNQSRTSGNKVILLAQLLSVLLIWVFVVAITIWIINLILLAVDLKDAPGASVAISVVAIPVFIILASVLTYVFVGLQKGRKVTSSKMEEN
jgi:hypothetical protein